MPVDAGINDPNSFYKGADSMNTMLQNFAKKKAGGQLASGDQPGAVSTLQQSGQLDEANQLQTQQLAIQEHARAFQTKMVGDISTSLDNIGTQYGWDKVLPAFDRMTPMFKQQGATDQQIQQMRSAIAQDPQSSVRMFSANAQKELQQYTLAPGQKRYDANGKVIAQGDPRYMNVGSGQHMMQLDPSAPPQQDQAQPSGGGDMGPDGGTLALPGLRGDEDAGLTDHQAVQTVESGGDPTALSPKGAEGTMQTMPTTLTKPGYGVRPAQAGPDGTIPAEEKTRVGNDYLSALQQHYGPVLGLVGYNWGPRKLEDWLAGGAQLQKLPPDVKQYLGSVLIAHARGLPLPQPSSHHPEEDQMAHRMPFQASQSGGPVEVAKGDDEFRPPTDFEKQTYPGVLWMTPHGPHLAPANAATPANTPSDDAINLAAQTHLITNQMPPLGMNNNTTRKLVMDREAAITKQHGWTGADVASLRAQYKADSGALSKLQGQRSQIGAYEETVSGSMGLVKQYEGALANTGWSEGNKVVNWVKRQQNDPQMKQLDNAISTVVNEYAKVISNATGGGVTSDQARDRANELLNSADSTQSMEGAISTLRQEMAFRVNSLDHGIDRLTGHIHMMLSDPAHATAVAQHLAKPTKAGHWDPKAGKVVWQ